MLKVYQQTILNPIVLSGIGLHSGEKVNLRILPGNDDQGLVFKRVDLKKNNFIFANFNNVNSTKLCTSIQNIHEVKVSTVEHLLAAFYIADIDNAVIEIDNEEIPIMDGSSKTFVEALKKSKVKILNKKRKYLKILNKVSLKNQEKEICIEPKDASFEIDFKLDYKNKVIGKQRNSINFYKDDLRDIYESRTFCLYDDIEKIKKIGLAKGGSLDNAIVVGQNKILNEEGLRNSKEFVNHKILDLAGDFLLSGYRILGKVTCNQGGHELTNVFLKKLLSRKSQIESFEIRDIKISTKVRHNQPIKVAVNA